MRMTAERCGAPRASATTEVGTPQLPMAAGATMALTGALAVRSGAVTGAVEASPVRTSGFMLQRALTVAAPGSQPFAIADGVQPWSAMGAVIAFMASHGA